MTRVRQRGASLDAVNTTLFIGLMVKLALVAFTLGGGRSAVNDL